MSREQEIADMREVLLDPECLLTWDERQRCSRLLAELERERAGRDEVMRVIDTYARMDTAYLTSPICADLRSALAAAGGETG